MAAFISWPTRRQDSNEGATPERNPPRIQVTRTPGRRTLPPTLMTPFTLPTGYPRLRIVDSFEALLATPFADGVNALCWPRELPGDFAEVIALLPAADGILPLDEATLESLPVSPAGRVAIDFMLADLRRLRDHDRDPVLNRIDGYPRDEDPGPVATDVMSFHADSAPVEADTWLCTYHGACSEGLRNDEALRKVDLPELRAALLAEFGGDDDADFAEYLNELHYDLHYAAAPGAQPFPSAPATSGASPSTGPAAPSRPASTAPRTPCPAIRRGCC